MQFLRSLTRASAVSALATGISYFLTILLARNGGPINYGEYAFCMAWAAIIITIINFASDSAFAHLVLKQNGNIQYAFNTIITARITVAVLVFIFIIIFNIFNLINIPWKVLFLIVPVFNLGFIYEYYQNNVVFAFNVFYEKLILLILNFIFLQIYDFQDVVYVLYFFVSIAFLLIQVVKYNSIVIKLRFVGINNAVSYFGSYWSLLGIALSQLGYGYVSRLLIENKLGMEVFSNVSLAFQVIALSSVYQGQVDRIFRRKFIDAGVNKDYVLYYDYFKKYLLLAICPLLICAIVLYLLSPTLILFLFGADYTYAAQILQVLSPLLVSVSFMRLIDIVMLSHGLEKYNLIINISISLIMIIIIYIMPMKTSLTCFMGIIVVSQYIQILLGFIVMFLCGAFLGIPWKHGNKKIDY